jgi:POLQ-like helicase
MKPLDFVRRYMRGKVFLDKWIAGIVRKHADKGFTSDGLHRQFDQRTEIIAAIESYLMTYWEETATLTGEEYARTLAEGTLAFSLSDDEKKKQTIELFSLLAEHIRAAVPDAKRRIAYGKTLQGLTAVLSLQTWVDANLTQLREHETHEELLATLWPILSESIDNRTFQKCDKPDAIREAAFRWLAGASFSELHGVISEMGAKIKAGSQRRDFTIDQLVDLCESGFGYDGALLIGAVADLLSTAEDEANVDLIVSLGDLHKRFKYGLATISAITLYECGFADREVCKDLALAMGGTVRGRQQAIEALKKNEDAALGVLGNFPSYFGVVLDNLYA